MIKSLPSFFLILLSQSAFALDSEPDPANFGINSASIAVSTVSGILSCAKPEIMINEVGCIHIVCDIGSGCKPVITPKIREYLPDLVVTVYPKAGSDPWFEMQTVLDVADEAAGSAAFALEGAGVPLGDGEANSVNSSNSATLK